MDPILWVDDDPDVLFMIRRTLEGRFTVEIADGPEQALSWIAAGKRYAVVGSDMRMSGMDGATFLQRLAVLTPDTVAVMMTGPNELSVAQHAVNEGHVFMFLTKSADQQLTPASSGYLSKRAARDVLEHTLVGAVKAPMDVLALAQPAFSRAGAGALISWPARRAGSGHRLADRACRPALPTGLHRPAPSDHAARGRREAIAPDEQLLYETYPQVGSDLLARIPRLEQVAEIIKCQAMRFDGAGRIDRRTSESIPLGARMFKIAVDFHRLCCSGLPAESALIRRQARDGWYDPDLLHAFGRCTGLDAWESVRVVAVSEIVVGME